MDYTKYHHRILITGGCGFIGSHLVRQFVLKYPDYLIVNFDALTYAGNIDNVSVVSKFDNYQFVKGDIRDIKQIEQVFNTFQINNVIHLAAESHVDRSIETPQSFIETNINGTFNLLQVALNYFEKDKFKRFYHLSTDEVYGSLGKDGIFTETSPYQPRSPYSASKASSDHLVQSFFHTYSLNTVISNCSNNYGSHQYPEKLIPVVIQNALLKKTIPVYGKGENIRDWIHVKDHVDAIDIIFHKGISGENYNVGDSNEWDNLSLVKMICKLMDGFIQTNEGTHEALIQFVTDRKGHDFRYAIDSNKLQSSLGWKPTIPFESGLSDTIKWYLSNQDWVKKSLQKK